MPSNPAAIYLDEDVSVVVAEILRARGFDVISVRDAGRRGQTDSQQLAFAASLGRAIVTHNRVDFESLHREWLREGKSHAGILVSRQRTARDIAARVGRLLIRLEVQDLRDQLLYV